MKKILVFGLILFSSVTLVACTKTVEVDKIVYEDKIVEVEVESIAGTYVGYSWKGEATGTLLENASQKIETTITLDEDGIITDAKILFWKMKDGSWYTRQDGTARISVDLGVTPVAATPGSSYAKGTSMFSVDTHDMMSLYSVVVDDSGNAALLIVEPVTRYQFEISLPNGYDYTQTVGDITVDGTVDGFIPTVRTSSSGLNKPGSWTELAGKDILSIHYYDHVMTDAGVFAGLTGTSTMQELLEAVGVEFTAGVPNELALDYGRHSIGGWEGNYAAIEQFIIGKDVNDITSLVDWTVERYDLGIDENNFFGFGDLVAGASKTAQDSGDGIAGATVRMSRESTSFQRALVAAGIINEEDVIKGRF